MATARSPARPGYGVTRLSALRQGVLSRYTVLPWENADKYRRLLAALVEEHALSGPTAEEHLVEELAGVAWRKRRLPLAEAAASRRALEATTPSAGFISVLPVLGSAAGSVPERLRATGENEDP